jgi:site-specific DNA-methyltransferase (adenine-specific)
MDIGDAFKKVLVKQDAAENISNAFNNALGNALETPTDSSQSSNKLNNLFANIKTQMDVTQNIKLSRAHWLCTQCGRGILFDAETELEYIGKVCSNCGYVVPGSGKVLQNTAEDILQGLINGVGTTREKVEEDDIEDDTENDLKESPGKKKKSMVDLILQWDCLNTFSRLDEASLDLVVTSPPYFVGKEYEKNVTWQEYNNLLLGVYINVKRCLKPGGYFVINFGDFHNSGNRFYKAQVTSTYPAAPLHFRLGREVRLDLQAARIWEKQHAKTKIGFVCNIRPRHAFDFEHVWTWRKRGNFGDEFVNNRSLSQRGVIGKDWKSPAKLDIHCAAFPIELPTWAIKVYTPDNTRNECIVYDPFMGSGTSIIACINEGCHYLGSECQQILQSG